jgi:hypothetical protein
LLDWLFGPKAKARQLNSDARAIVQVARDGYRVETTRAMALLTRETIDDTRAYALARSEGPKLTIERLEMYHRNAKSSRDQVKLTAYTLAIIYLRAEGLGELAAPARAEIDQFYADWAHSVEPSS